MQWRARTDPEVALGLASDIMTLGGITAGTPYVADMYYNPASLLAPPPMLVYNPSDSIWVNAVNGNTGNNATGGELGYVGTFAAFQTWVGDTEHRRLHRRLRVRPGHQSGLGRGEPGRRHVRGDSRAGHLGVAGRRIVGHVCLRLAKTEVTESPLSQRERGQQWLGW